MFLCRNKKNNVYPCKPQFYYIKIGFKGSKLYRYLFVTEQPAYLCSLIRLPTVGCWITKDAKKVREKSRECHNHKPQPFSDIKRKRKPTNPNKHKSVKHTCTKSTKISSPFPKRGNRNTKRTEKHKNKMAQGKKYNKSPRRINHKAPKSKTNTGTTAIERSVE